MKAHETAIIEKGSIIGTNTSIWHFSHIREGSVIGKNCTIGKDVYVDKGVVIGDNVKIQNGVSLYDGLIVGNDVFIGPHSVFTNDLHPRAFKKDWEKTETILRNGCSIGANSTIICGNVIGAYSMVAAGAVVSQDVAPFSMVMGNPARIIGMICKEAHKMEKVNKVNEKLKFYCKTCDEEISLDLNISTKTK